MISILKCIENLNSWLHSDIYESIHKMSVALANSLLSLLHHANEYGNEKKRFALEAMCAFVLLCFVLQINLWALSTLIKWLHVYLMCYAISLCVQNTHLCMSAKAGVSKFLFLFFPHFSLEKVLGLAFMTSIYEHRKTTEIIHLICGEYAK